MHYWIIALIASIGAVGGFVNVFIGDSGLHLPRKDPQTKTWQPGFLGVVIVGSVAAVGSWATLRGLDLIGPNATPLPFTTGDFANALVIGFGGAKWFKSEHEKDTLQEAGALVATKKGHQDVAGIFRAGTPLEALKAAKNMT